MVAQRYLLNPFLIDGFKFDLRIYALVYSVAPLVVYLYNDGLARLCTSQYVKPSKGNMENTTMHLTNYSLNKQNDAFEDNNSTEEANVGSKRRWGTAALIAFFWCVHTHTVCCCCCF